MIKTYMAAISFLLFSMACFSADTHSSKKSDTCETCHGTEGQGNISVGAPKLAGMEDWYLKRQLFGFRNQFRGIDTIAGREMKAIADDLSFDDISESIKMITSWPAAKTRQTIKGDLAQGKKTFKSCIPCHGEKAEGNMQYNAPSLLGQNDWYLATQLVNYKSGARGTHADDDLGRVMRPFAEHLDEKGIKDVVRYIQSLSK